MTKPSPYRETITGGTRFDYLEAISHGVMTKVILPIPPPVSFEYIDRDAVPEIEIEYQEWERVFILDDIGMRRIAWVRYINPLD